MKKKRSRTNPAKIKKTFDVEMTAFMKAGTQLKLNFSTSDTNELKKVIADVYSEIQHKTTSIGFGVS